MAKRASTASQLTGGTNDVNPQFLSGLITLSAANTATEVTLGTPIVRVGPQTGGQAIIMELLKVFWLSEAAGPVAAAAETSMQLSVYASTRDHGATATSYAVTDVFDGFRKNASAAFTAAGTYYSVDDAWESHDLTDGAGHGILIATDNIYLQISSAGLAAARSVSAKLLYRWKEIDLVEYIGIVQSQQ